MRPHISTAAFVRLIFLKDVRAVRYPLLLLLVLTIGFILLPISVDQAEYRTLIPVFGGIFIGLAIFLLTMVIQSDPVGREFRFLLTRPVPGSAIGLAKALFLTLFVMAPYWLGLEFIVAYSQVPLNPLDRLLLLIETVITCGTGMAFLVLCCVFLRNGIRVVLVLVIVSVVGSYLSIWWQQRTFQTGGLPPWLDLEHEHLSQFRTFLSEAVFLVFALLAIVLRYRTKRFLAPLILALGGYALSQLAFLCPYNFAQGLQDQSSNRSLLTPEQLGRIKMTLIQGEHEGSPYSLSGGGWNGIYYVFLNHTVRLEGLEPRCFVQTVGYHAVITLRSGKTFTSDYADFNGHGGVGGLYTIMLGVAQGLTSWPNHEDLTLDLMSYLPRSLPDEDITGATVKGVITLEVRRAYVAGAIPLRSHAFLDGHRRRYEIESADFSGDAVTFRLNILRAPLILRGDLANWNTPDDLQWLPFYRPLGQALQPRGTGSQGSSGIGVQVNPQTGTCIWPMKNTISDWRPCPSDWASGAELVFIGSDPCGQVTLPYEIDNVDLHYRF
jgi:hypothetical protein